MNKSKSVLLFLLVLIIQFGIPMSSLRAKALYPVINSGIESSFICRNALCKVPTDRKTVFTTHDSDSLGRNPGLLLPWIEDWSMAGTGFEAWNFYPSQGNWRISNVIGNPVPSAEFHWAPPKNNYSFILESPELYSDIENCSSLKLSFDIKLDDRLASASEFMGVEVFWDSIWHPLVQYTNTASLNWITTTHNISQAAGKTFKVRFIASGANSANVYGWFIDNIHVYQEVAPPLNLDFDVTGWNWLLLSWSPPVCEGWNLILKKIFQYEGDPVYQVNGHFQQYNYAYGVVYDLSNYQDALLSKIDFHHASWGTNGTWQYKIHIVDWASGAPIQVLGPFSTTGNDKWETDISLGNIMGYGGGLIGIMLEPLSNSSTDAYPCLSSDNDGPAGVYVFGVLPDYATFGSNTIGDFYMNLWILTNSIKSGSPKHYMLSNRKNSENGSTRLPGPSCPTVGGSHNQTEVSVKIPRDSSVFQYNVYRKLFSFLVEDYELLNPLPINDTFYSTFMPLPPPGYFGYCYKVTAVHQGVITSLESGSSNEECLIIVNVPEETTIQKLSIFPNPAVDIVQISTDFEINRIELLKFTGQCLLRIQGASQKTLQLNTSTLAPGVYFVRIVNTKGLECIRKLIISK
ncbi:MAG: T9SS type A sorting domain-containing protein [Bacteroidales bacterium]|nr:T9SS type A sorting domain-containing protein [Bacteroidales bacterium]